MGGVTNEWLVGMRSFFRRRNRRDTESGQGQVPNRPRPASPPDHAGTTDSPRLAPAPTQPSPRRSSETPRAVPPPNVQLATPNLQQSHTLTKARLVQPQRGVATWVPADAVFEVDGREISGGMVYVGSRANAAAYAVTEPCLIDRSLRVDWRRPDWSGSTMNYWPSYDTSAPEARGAYLNWLMGGRREPSAYIGYVFLFFYGLERRLFVDLANDRNCSETEELAAEVRRLLDIYGGNRSFSGYATGFLDLIVAMKSLACDLELMPWDPDHRGWEIPSALRLGLGRLAATGTRLPVDWALSYLRYHPENGLRTAAHRCKSQFDELFRIRYRERYPDGIKMRPPARKVSFTYYPASAGFGGAVAVQTDVPDIASVVGPLNKLKDLGAECMDELDALSRFLGRRPEESESASAVSLLPEALLATHGGSLVERMNDWVASALAKEPFVAVSLDELVQLWSPEREEKLAKRDAASLASLLAKLGIGLEPDVRFGASTPKPGSTVVIFPLPEGSSAAPSTAYTAAVSLVHLAALVAVADGTISPAEQHHLAEHIEQVLGLDASEHARLEAHFVLLTASKPGMAGLKRKVEALSSEERIAVGSFLIDIAAADGVVSPEEISTITKIFRLLELDEADVYSQVHALATGDPGPVTVRESSPTTRWAIPEPATESPAGALRLDHAKVQARLAETAHVAALLTDIFAEDDGPSASPHEPTVVTPETPAQPRSDSMGVSSIDGLDEAHSALATALARQSAWPRFAVEEVATSLGLPFLDGALDVINEAAIEICGEPLIDGEDPLETNSYALEEVL